MLIRSVKLFNRLGKVVRSDEGVERGVHPISDVLGLAGNKFSLLFFNVVFFVSIVADDQFMDLFYKFFHHACL